MYNDACYGCAATTATRDNCGSSPHVESNGGSCKTLSGSVSHLFASRAASSHTLITHSATFGHVKDGSRAVGAIQGDWTTHHAQMGGYLGPTGAFCVNLLLTCL